MAGFFSESELSSKKPLPVVSRCGQCGLFKDAKTPRMKPRGKGKKKILVLGESPGKNEDEKGRQFIGKAGRRLRESLDQVGIDFDRDCWVTNACCCRKVEQKGSETVNTPTDEMIECCRPNVFKAIKEFDPNVLLLLGGSAIKSVLGHFWKEEIGGVNRWSNYAIPWKKPNMWIVPTVHPSFVERVEHNQEGKEWERWFTSHLELAKKKCKNKPKPNVTANNNDVQIVTNPKTAAKMVLKIPVQPIAFDFETNCLKPDGEGPEIISCSICYGKTTIAYPWQGDAIDATSKILKAEHQKIASNIKFEERWTRAVLKHPVTNWLIDTMITAHLLDNRSGVTSIKFQSFVRLGQEPYDHHIKPLLLTTKTKRFNRIREIAIKNLLLYNGIDSKVEYHVGQQQLKEIKELQCQQSN